MYRNNSTGTIRDKRFYLIDINDIAWAGEPGYISSEGVWVPTSTAASTKIMAMTQMKIPVIAGHTYVYNNLPENPTNPVGTIMGIHWFDNTYTQIDKQQG